MKILELQAALDKADRYGNWFFTTPMLKRLFPEDSENTLLVSLRRHVLNGVIATVKKGIYYNPRARSIPADPIYKLVNTINPGELNYLSFESVLSESGDISQILMDHVTIGTTGRSRTIQTEFGTIEFIHVAHDDPATILMGTTLDQGRGLLVASADFARADLHRSRRQSKELLQEQDSKVGIQ